MKKLSFILILILHSSLFQAQEKRTSIITMSDSTKTKFGQLIKVLPFEAKIYKNGSLNAQELFENIKNSCKGKAIFIDIWATWCSPCLKEWPNIKRIYNETKDLPIEFIYICTDYSTNINCWESTISIFEQPGIHLFVENNILNDLWRLFPISPNFPAYAFIDINGKFKPEAIPQNTAPNIEGLKKFLNRTSR